MSTDRGINRQIVVYSHKGILVSNKREQTTDTGNNINKSQKYYTNRKSQAPKSIYCMILFI